MITIGNYTYSENTKRRFDPFISDDAPEEERDLKNKAEARGRESMISERTGHSYWSIHISECFSTSTVRVRINDWIKYYPLLEYNTGREHFVELVLLDYIFNNSDQ